MFPKICEEIEINLKRNLFEQCLTKIREQNCNLTNTQWSVTSIKQSFF